MDIARIRVETGDRAGVRSGQIAAGQSQGLGIRDNRHIAADVDLVIGLYAKIGAGVGILRSAAVESERGDAHIAVNGCVPASRCQEQMGVRRSGPAQVRVICGRFDNGVMGDADLAARRLEAGLCHGIGN